MLYVQFPYLAATPPLAAAVLMVSLLWPTFFMGLSLPLLARALTGSVEMTARVVGSLYGWNTLGAASGAFLSTWVLLPRLGLEHSLWLAAASSLACAAAAAAMLGPRGALISRQPGNPSNSTKTIAPATSEPLSFTGWALVYGMAGFIALALEVTWFRLLGVMLKSTAFTFGTLLGVYLSGLGLGATLASRRVHLSRRPGMTFLRLQCGVVLYTAVSTVALVAAIASGHPIKLVRYLGGYEPLDVQATVALLRGVGLADSPALTPFFDLVIRRRAA